MTGKSGGVTDNDEFHPGAGDGDVHPAQVVQEADVAFLVGTDKTDENDIAFLPLESVDGVDGDESSQRVEESVAFDQLADVDVYKRQV